MTSAPPRQDPASAAPALEITGLVRRFGDFVAVDGIDLTLPRGKILALLGPNGAGKTTTVEICEGFARPDAGHVRVLGLDPWRDSAALRPRMGVMLQAGGAHASAKVGEMLALIAACSANPLSPKWLLKTLGLSEVTNTAVRRLSGGQAQRLSLAMALVGRPEILFLDEPTAGMDPQARHLVWDLLKAARQDGVAVLLTTHLLDEAELLADHVVIVDNGRVVASGSLAELIGGESDHLAFSAISGLNLDLVLTALPHGYSAAEREPGHYRIYGDITPTAMATVTAWCAQVGVLVTDLRVGQRSLDDVYLELTGRKIRA
ncbi:ABC transporter ATP-binding protein [Nakamurella antarctica]|uniref:ABC transporter ATP-binding protein n=1 Tax=Nakamurella antarctica TaxID=1902245 RepID=A0A3G8ZL59_9ACTN|nr:ABC transporter ATP-binding protein [Nakamurella antarctica]AZI58062.1 ABC transporter ATP-binding protein [Nakamurella antarctica]